MAVLSLTALQASAYTYDISGRDDFRDESIYFIITTRFFDGDSNNNVYCWDGTLNQQAHDPEWRGDFQGLIDRMDYIKALGFTAIWMTPIVENASGLDYHGYHAMDFSNVDPRYYDYYNYATEDIKDIREQGDKEFEKVIKAAHDKGLKIILDIVLNHTGNFGEATLCPMFEKDYTQNLGEINSSLKMISGCGLDQHVGSSTYYANEDQQYSWRLGEMKNTTGQNYDKQNHWHHYGNFDWDNYTRWYAQIAGDCVDLNTENPAVAAYLVNCYGRFIDLGVDGFRIDTSGHIPRVTFNNAFIPQFIERANSPTALEARNNGPFFMFGEVCARNTEVVYRSLYNMSPFYYTWKEGTNGEGTYSWIDNNIDDTSWDNIVVMEGGLGDHTNMNSTLAQGSNGNISNLPSSNNVFLNGNDYHTPDYSNYSGFSVIDFPMHWMFYTADKAFSMQYGDSYYNDASYNVVYVDSHDYSPDECQTMRYTGGTYAWAENMDLMFTFRGIPCIYYGSEIEFKKGCVIDNGANTALKDTGRAYYGGYLKGSITANEFGENYEASGNVATTLSQPLARHLQQLNKIRANVPALRRGQYSTDGVSGNLAFKRRYTANGVDSYALVVISGSATFTGLPSATWVDVVTGDTQTGSTVTASCSGQGNMRVYVMNGSQLISDGPFLYGGSSTGTSYSSWDGTEEEDDEGTSVPSGSGGSSVEEPDEVIEPTLYKGEQAIFFDNNSSNWSGTIDAWVWNDEKNYTGGSWPGTACTYLGNGYWKWTYSGTDTVSGYCIFDNGSSQTADMTYVNGGMYNANGYMYTLPETDEDNPNPNPTDPDPVTPDTTSNTWVVYFTDNYTPVWSQPYVWIWDNANTSKNYTGGTWPGKTMTAQSDGTWMYTFTTDDTITTPMVIFSNGVGGDDKPTSQTEDLPLQNYGLYNRNGFVEDETPTGVNAIKAVASEDEWYTLQGVKIEHPLYRGIYIKNGKKVVIR